MSAVENFILDLNEPQRSIMIQLHELINSFPEITPVIKWKTPVYYTSKYICYLNAFKRNDKVEICFVNGSLLDDPNGLLESRNRKIVKGLILSEINSEHLEGIQKLVRQAIRVNP